MGRPNLNALGGIIAVTDTYPGTLWSGPLKVQTQFPA